MTNLRSRLGSRAGKIRAALASRFSGNRTRYVLVFAFLAIVTWICVVNIVVYQGLSVDFRSFYAAAAAARHGLDAYDFKVITAVAKDAHFPKGPLYPYLYPPFFSYTFSWLSRLELLSAQSVWSTIAVIAYSLASTFTVRAAMNSTRGAEDKPDEIPPALLLAAALAPFALNLPNNIGMGQINPLVLAFISGAIMLSTSGRFFWAGFVLAFAGAIKITPLLFVVPWLLDRRWRALLGVLAGLVTTVLVTLPLGAASAWVSFFRHLPEMSHGSTIPGLFAPKETWNFSVAGFYARFLATPGGVRIAAIGTLLLLLTVLCVVAYRARSPKRYERTLLPLSALMVMWSPFAYTHHVLYVMPGVLITLHHEMKADRRVATGFLVLLSSLAAIDFPVLYTRFRPFPGRLYTSLNLYLLLLMFVVGLVWLARERRLAVAAAAAAPGLCPGPREGYPPLDPDQGEALDH